MSEEASNGQIYTVLMELKEAMGEVRSSTAGTRDWLAQHVIETRATMQLTDARIQNLQLSQARQRGFITAVAGVAGAISAGIGWAVQYLVHRGT